jgi:hypothetical protein
MESGLNNFRRLQDNKQMKLNSLDGFVGRMAANIKYLKSIPDGEYSIEKVKELIANASRRAEEGKYDDAVARLYRATEMLAQVGFMEQFGQSTSKFPARLLPDSIRRLFFRDESPDAEKGFGFQEAYQVLDAVGHQYGKTYHDNEDKFKAIMCTRNCSILAHGSIPLDKTAYDKLYTIFREAFFIDGSDIKFAKIALEELLPAGLE